MNKYTANHIFMAISQAGVSVSEGRIRDYARQNGLTVPYTVRTGASATRGQKITLIPESNIEAIVKGLKLAVNTRDVIVQLSDVPEATRYDY